MKGSVAEDIFSQLFLSQQIYYHANNPHTITQCSRTVVAGTAWQKVYEMISRRIRFQLQSCDKSRHLHLNRATKYLKYIFPRVKVFGQRRDQHPAPFIQATVTLLYLQDGCPATKVTHAGARD